MFVPSLTLILLYLGASAAYSRWGDDTFSECNQNGYTCLYTGSKITTLKYECPQDRDTSVIYINSESYPSSLEKLEIRNCQTLRFFAIRRLNDIRRPMLQHLLVANIQRLVLKHIFGAHVVLSSTVIFENISNIELIPFKTFSLCQDHPDLTTKNIIFKNVSIGVIENDAFFFRNHYPLMNFSFVDVSIKRVEDNGIRIETDTAGSVKFQNCKIDVIEIVGIRVNAPSLVFSESQFDGIQEHSIIATVNDFSFTDNVVGTVDSQGFAISATNISFLRNTFLHLKSQALENLRPGVMQESGRNFENLTFIYHFKENSLNVVDAGSLNPNLTAYDNVTKEIMFSRNKFLCSCQNMGWLYSPLMQGPHTIQQEPFYDMVLDEYYANTCETPSNTSCDLSIKKMGQIIKHGKCLTIQDLCVEIDNSGLVTEQTTEFV